MQTLKMLVAGLFLLSMGYAGDSKEMLVRVTFYYPNEDGSGFKGSTGVKLQPWKHCAVDPRIINYFRTVHIPGLGSFTSVDRGSAVVSRRAAKLSGKNVPVVDVCVKSRREMDRLAATFPRFVTVTIKS